MNKPNQKIIQIGYVIADTRKNEIVFSRCITVDPKETLDPFIIELTGITQEDVDKAWTLEEAYETLVYDVKTHNVPTLWAQWGIGDTNLLREQLGLTWENFVCRRRAIDVKSIYQAYAAFNGETTKTGLAKALEKCGLEFHGREHNAYYDAYNTYKILHHLSNKMVKFDKIQKVIA